MLQLIPKTKINFIGKRYIFFAISGIVMFAGLVSLILKGGPKWGLDFTGGTLIEVKFENPPSMEDVRNALSQSGIPAFELQSVPDHGVFIIRTQLKQSSTNSENPESTDDSGNQLQAALQKAFADHPFEILRREFVGPTVGKHLGKNTLIAFIFTFIGIIIYVAFRFHSGIWGTSGVLALIHDVVTVVGIFSIFNIEITVTVVAALLTIAGYSINDTIVIFDFMRERLRLRRTESFGDLINESLNATLSRTMITGIMVFFVVLVLFFFGGEVIHSFAFAMVLGVAIGTYSSVAVAAPLIYEWEIRKNKKG